MAWKRWEDWTNLVLGGWLIFAPAILGLTGTGATLSLWLGIAVVLVAVWALAVPSSNAAQYSMLALGVGYFFAPWLFGFAADAGAAWNAWVVSVGIGIFGTMALSKTRAARDRTAKI